MTIPGSISHPILDASNIISFQSAKYISELGFDKETTYHYIVKSDDTDEPSLVTFGTKKKAINSPKIPYKSYVAPTYEEVINWIYLKFNIVFSIVPRYTQISFDDENDERDYGILYSYNCNFIQSKLWLKYHVDTYGELAKCWETSTYRMFRDITGLAKISEDDRTYSIKYFVSYSACAEHIIEFLYYGETYGIQELLPYYGIQGIHGNLDPAGMPGNLGPS